MGPPGAALQETMPQCWLVLHRGQGLEGRAHGSNCLFLHPVQCTAQLGPRSSREDPPVLPGPVHLCSCWVGVGGLGSVAGSGLGRA